MDTIVCPPTTTVTELGLMFTTLTLKLEAVVVEVLLDVVVDVVLVPVELLVAFEAATGAPGILSVIWVTTALSGGPWATRV